MTCTCALHCLHTPNSPLVWRSLYCHAPTQAPTFELWLDMSGALGRATRAYAGQAGIQLATVPPPVAATATAAVSSGSSTATASGNSTSVDAADVPLSALKRARASSRGSSPAAAAASAPTAPVAASSADEGAGGKEAGGTGRKVRCQLCAFYLNIERVKKECGKVDSDGQLACPAKRKGFTLKQLDEDCNGNKVKWMKAGVLMGKGVKLAPKHYQED